MTNNDVINGKNSEENLKIALEKVLYLFKY